MLECYYWDQLSFCSFCKLICTFYDQSYFEGHAHDEDLIQLSS